MEKYTLTDMKRAFETGRNFQLTGENNFQELIDGIDDKKQKSINRNRHSVTKNEIQVFNKHIGNRFRIKGFGFPMFRE